MKTDAKNIITNIIIVVLSIILIISTFTLIQEVTHYRYTYKTSTNTFYTQIGDGTYFSMPDEVRQNRILGVYESKEYKECYAVSDYFEAAGLYRAYQENGETELAAKYKRMMEESKANMGDLGYTEGEINQKLGLDEETLNTQ